MKLDTAMLHPGDVLLYRRTPLSKSPAGWLFGLAINVKTWSDFSHVEIYDGDGESLASRDGAGVGCYPLRLEELACVRRPIGDWYDHGRVRRWFDATAEGQGYDWKGLLCFTLAAKQGARDRMFCSEFACRAARIGMLKPFNPSLDADKVAPAQFWHTPAYDTIWEESG